MPLLILLCTRLGANSLSFDFPRAEVISSLRFPPGPQILADVLHVLISSLSVLAITAVESMNQGNGVGEWGMQITRAIYWPAGEICVWGIPSCCNCFLIESLMWVSRIHAPLMDSKNPIDCSASLFLSPSDAVHDSVLCMRQERNGPSWHCLAQLGNPGTHPHTFVFLYREIMG